MKRSLPHMAIYILLLVTSVARGASALPDAWSAAVQASTARLLRTGLDAGSLIPLTTTLHESGFTDQQIIETQEVIYAAIDQGLPPTPLLDKAQEGLAKHVPAPKIITAMHQVRSRYASAYRRAGSLSGDPVLRADLARMLAGAEAAGIQSAHQEQIITALRLQASETPRPRQRDLLLYDTLMTSRDLARRGISSELFSEIITGLLTMGANGSEITSVAQAITKRHDRLSINERARICLSIIDGETSAATVVHALQQQNGFLDNNNGSGSGSGAAAGPDNRRSKGQGGDSRDGGVDNPGGKGGRGDSSSGSSGESGKH